MRRCPCFSTGSSSFFHIVGALARRGVAAFTDAEYRRWHFRCQQSAGEYGVAEPQSHAGFALHARNATLERFARELRRRLGGHLKTAHPWAVENRTLGLVIYGRG